MSLTAPPAVITALRDALIGCAAWTYGTSAVWYPDAPAGTSGPFAVLALDGRTASIHIYGALTVGAMQALGYALQQQLMSRFRTGGTGLIIASEPQAGDVTETTDAQTAAGDSLRSITITADIGIQF